MVDDGDDDASNDIVSEMKESGTLLSCDQSVTKLIKLLEENSFVSGQHIDYYDI